MNFDTDVLKCTASLCKFVKFVTLSILVQHDERIDSKPNLNKTLLIKKIYTYSFKLLFLIFHGKRISKSAPINQKTNLNVISNIDK